MKLTFKFFAVIVILFMVGCQRKSHSQADESEVMERRLIEFYQARIDHNLGKLKQMATKDVVIIIGEEVFNADSLHRLFIESYPKQIDYKNELENINMKQLGDIGWLTYYHTAQCIFPDRKRSEKELVTTILVRENNTWKVAQTQSKFMYVSF